MVVDQRAADLRAAAADARSQAAIIDSGMHGPRAQLAYAALSPGHALPAIVGSVMALGAEQRARNLEAQAQAPQTQVKPSTAAEIMAAVKAAANRVHLTAQAREEGGPVEPKKPYLVGEKGPEIIVPKQAGTVIPTEQTMGLLSKTTGSRTATPQRKRQGLVTLPEQAKVAPAIATTLPAPKPPAAVAVPADWTPAAGGAVAPPIATTLPPPRPPAIEATREEDDSSAVADYLQQIELARALKAQRKRPVMASARGLY